MIKMRKDYEIVGVSDTDEVYVRNNGEFEWIYFGAREVIEIARESGCCYINNRKEL